MSEYDGDDRRSQTEWHLKKEVPIATILAMVGSIATGAFFVADIQSQVVIVQHELSSHIKIDAEREARHADSDREMLNELREIRKDITSIKVSLASKANRP